MPKQVSDEDIRAALKAAGGHRAEAAKIAGISERALYARISRMEDVPDPTPRGVVKGTSTLYDATTGEAKLIWVKEAKEAAAGAIEAAAQAAFREIPRYRPKKYSQKALNQDIIPWFQIGDAHLGMVAYHYETGHNFDLRIARRELCKAMESLIDRSWSAERAVIQDLGDMTHYENFAGETEASKHRLDFDGRFTKMVDVYVETMFYIIDAALDKFKYVDVIINQGNHSRTNDVWARKLLEARYERTKRLHVLDNSNVFIPYRMGNTFVMCHHSDKCRGPKLIDVMSTDYRQDFGEAKYKYIDNGHIHHKSVSRESGDVIVESWNQLAPNDKWAHDAGYRSRAFLSVVYRSKTYGEKGRETITVEEVKDMIDGAEPGTAAQERREVYTVS